jgi:excinuclease UvrABC helicase subunit UvrB
MFGRNFNDFNELFNSFDRLFGMQPMIGKTKTENGSDDSGDWKKETFTSNDGMFTVTSFTRVYGKDLNSSKQISEIDLLKSNLDLAVKNEEFEKAIELRDKIKNLETNSKNIKELEEKLNLAIKSEDFEQAIKIRDEIKKLKS